MKKIFILLYFFCNASYSQYEQNIPYSQLYNGTEICKGIYSSGRGEEGITFVSNDGKQYGKYFKDVTNQLSVKCGLIIYRVGKDLHNPDYENAGLFKVHPLLAVAKELHHIDETYLDQFIEASDKAYHNYPNDYIEEFIYKVRLAGYARRGGKYACITKFGELITDFIYDKDGFGLYRINAAGNKVYYEMHSFREEIYSSMMPLSYKMGKDIYEVYDDKGNYYLQYQNHMYSFDVLRQAIDLGMPVNCNVLSDGRTIYKLVKGNIKKIELKGYRVRTNFYNNRAIAATRDSETGTERLVIINESGKAVIRIPGNFTTDDFRFDKFGLISISSEKGHAVIDYNGNFIIPVCSSCDLKFIGDGLYGVFFMKDSINLDFEKSGFYNQDGIKILPAGNSYLDPKAKLVEGIKYNYLMSGSSVFYVLDKNNILVKR